MSVNARAKSSIDVRRLPVRLSSEDRRVMPRSLTFLPRNMVNDVYERCIGLSEDDVRETLEEVRDNFDTRHENLDEIFEEHCYTVLRLHGLQPPHDRRRQLLMGAYLTLEYSIQSAALFNPSMVLHPDQSGVPDGGVRFIMSLRATGEGHVSSIVFITGVIQGNHRLKMDVPSPFTRQARLAPDQYYLKYLFRRKLDEMDVNLDVADRVLQGLPERFTFAQLEERVESLREQLEIVDEAALSSVLWLARANYQLVMPPGSEASDIVIFPQNDNESRGVEDLRLVRFTNDNGSHTYYGTYTAYNGARGLPMLLETSDFQTLHLSTLNGTAALNKGMALFPRPVRSHYCMCGRIDGQNLYLMYSDHVHFWESAELLTRPKYPWELTLMGNCGSPIETPDGWLLLTHGVGPMRRYCIGAMLLDLKNPRRIIGRLDRPILEPSETERDGYVPNVVYSCGALAHNRRLYLPYAMSDKATSIATVDMGELLTCLKNSPA